MIKRKRVTKETQVELMLDIAQPGTIEISTGHGFFDHMLHQLAYHAGWSLNIKARGDKTGDHHLVEDTALSLGDAFAAAWRSREVIGRFGQALLPMDETLIMAAVDLSGRPHCTCELGMTRERVGGLDSEMVPHFFRSFAVAAGISLHVRRIDGLNHHHIIEASFKALARALRMALDDRFATYSTKGIL